MLILPLLTIAGLVFWSKSATQKKRLFHSTGIFLGIAIFSYFNSVSALAAPDAATPGSSRSFDTEKQQRLEESLNLTPGGGHYSGLEYADRTARLEQALSDDQIEQTIEQYSNDDLTVAVANGSVRLSGRVTNKDVARHIINQTKAIPGVHEITFNLGLDNGAS